LDNSVDLANLDFTACPTRISCEELVLDVDDLSGVACSWLIDMELIRIKSKNLNGRLSDCLKDRISCTWAVIKSLLERVKDTGDISYLRRRNDELAAQLRESKKEESRLQSFLKEADMKAEKLNTEISELRRMIGSKSSSSAEPERPVQSVRDRQGTPRMKIRRKRILPERSLFGGIPPSLSPSKIAMNV